MRRTPVAMLLVPLWALLAVPGATAAQQSERYTLSGDDVALYNLAGVARVEGGSGSDVVVELTRGGRDAAKLSVERGPLRGRETLRVIYPDDDIVYRELSGGSSTTIHVRDDGTFNDHHDRRWAGRRVRISGGGGGLEAHADLRVTVPVGKRVALHLAVGQALVSNVNGDVRVAVAAASVSSDRTRGSLSIDAGSGDVRISDAEGDVSLDTGSGSVTVNGMRGSALRLDTGSGEVTVDQIRADALKIDTGSGDVRAAAIRSRDVAIDTGSGGVRLDLLTDVESLLVDTGSGDVTIQLPADFGARVDLSTGSGDIDLRGVQVKTTRMRSDRLTGEIGDGRGELRVSTGSGGITLQR